MEVVKNIKFYMAFITESRNLSIICINKKNVVPCVPCLSGVKWLLISANNAPPGLLFVAITRYQ